MSCNDVNALPTIPDSDCQGVYYRAQIYRITRSNASGVVVQHLQYCAGQYPLSSGGYCPLIYNFNVPCPDYGGTVAATSVRMANQSVVRRIATILRSVLTNPTVGQSENVKSTVRKT